MEVIMGKNMIIINPHSFIDVITNSSTELFVCDTDKNIEIVREMLKKIVEYWNMGVDLGINSTKITIDDIHVYVFDKKTLDGLKKGYDGWGGYGYETTDNIGKIIIEGVYDNSIPYELFDTINRVFNGYNYHLG